ncbi:MAG: DNA polymerase IV [Phycisphaerales bacterium]
MPWPRTILHVDMDAFYASVEQLDDPSLRGRPVLVGGSGRRGVVCAASYEARRFGCRSAMPMAQARALCPQAIIVKPHFDRYHECSDRLMEILESFSPLVQPLSLDEAFVDVSGSLRLFGDGVSIARTIRQRVRDEVHLTCSVGVAPNKFVAKLASDLNKPDGLTVIAPDEVVERLAPLAIERMWGVGPVAAETFRRYGFKTFGDVQQASDETLAALFGDHGEHWKALAFGRDERPVAVERVAASVGHEQTFGEDLRTPAEVETHLAAQAEAVAGRLRRKRLKAARVTVKIRFGDFRTITRSTTLPNATDRTDVLRDEARSLFRAWASSSFRPVRLIGCTASGISTGDEQLELFSDPRAEKRTAVDRVADAIRAKFGRDAITPVDELEAKPSERLDGTPRDALATPGARRRSDG